MKFKNHKRNISKVIIFLAVCYSAIFFTDYKKCTNLEKPIFVVPIETSDDGVTGTYQGLGYKVLIETQPYNQNEKSQIISVIMKIFNKVIGASIT